MDFGRLQDSINTIIVENYENKEFVKPFVKKYIKLLKENKVLNSLFIVYNNINTTNLTDNNLIREVIETSINSIKEKYNTKEINETVKLLKEELNIEIVSDEENPLYDYIKTLLVKEHNVKNIKLINETKENLIKLIKDKSNRNNINLINNKENVELVNEIKSLDDLDIIADISLKKLDEKYNLGKIEKLILESKVAEEEEDKINMFNVLKEEAKKSLDKIIEENVVANDIKVLALNAKVKLYEMSYDSERYNSDIDKFATIISDNID